MKILKKKQSVTLGDLAATMRLGFKKTTEDNESLAQMVAKGFEDVGGRMDKLEGRMGKLETEMSGLRSSVNNYLKLSDKRYLELKNRQDLIVSWVKKIAVKTKVNIDFKELETIR